MILVLICLNTIILVSTACEDNTYGDRCSETCSPNCAGHDQACDNVDGFCILGCIDGYTGKKCDDSKSRERKGERGERERESVTESER